MRPPPPFYRPEPRREEVAETMADLFAALGLASSPADKAGLARAVERWYRGLARDYHPDRGGSDAEMAAVSEAYRRLKEALGL